MSVYVFPGQGSQFKGMGADLFDLFPELTETASQLLGYSIKQLCVEDPHQQLNDTRFTQPALYVVNALSYRKKQQEAGDKPNYLAGHSLGEYNALEAAGAMSFSDGLKLVGKRGALMSSAPKGGMAAVIGMTEADVRERLSANGLSTIDIANLNAPTQTILSGLSEDIERAAAFFENGPVRYVPLNTSGAFHSRYMEPAKREFEAYLRGFSFSPLSIPVISNVDGLPYRPGDIQSNLAAQITHSVQWTKSIRYLLDQGETAFHELGVGQVLTRLIGAIRQHAPSTAEQPAAIAVAPSSPHYDREAEQAALHRQIDEWNLHHPVGTQVEVASYDQILITRSKALPLFGHRAAIYLEGYNGYFELNEVHPAKAGL
ncbi:ACP S-malonyltransferase [Chromobacterium sphagni]|uniref:[acyl-carrier-protein] S-malonyltransferase n=1 Tax=Chromobacterium sphagni TaxID=1903179 RepID=A0ABX3CF31_9NEIS|nr:ACP S-malonyltransferase [Chromobacterium sphagni]OHX20697.1 [acyl-carrier-protein] S-malonyltransferase [Chromobacterium sphagni]